MSKDSFAKYYEKRNKEKIQKRAREKYHYLPEEEKEKKQEYDCKHMETFLKIEKKNCKNMVSNSTKIFLMIKDKLWLNVGKNTTKY